MFKYIFHGARAYNQEIDTMFRQINYEKAANISLRRPFSTIQTPSIEIGTRIDSALMWLGEV